MEIIIVLFAIMPVLSGFLMARDQVSGLLW